MSAADLISLLPYLVIASTSLAVMLLLAIRRSRVGTVMLTIAAAAAIRIIRPSRLIPWVMSMSINSLMCSRCSSGRSAACWSLKGGGAGEWARAEGGCCPAGDRRAQQCRGRAA